MRWQNKRASGAGLFGKSIRPEKITTPALVVAPENNKKSGSVCRGTADSRKTWLLPWTKKEVKFYLVYGLAGIVIASMVRTLSESRNNINKQPTKGRK
jgi:hypothetical protein